MANVSAMGWNAQVNWRGFNSRKLLGYLAALNQILHTMAKRLTNEKSLSNLIKDLGGCDAAFLRERILMIFELTINDIENHPDKWNNGFVSPAYYRTLNDKVQKHLAFED